MNPIVAQAGTLSGLDWGIVGVGAVLLFVISYVFGREEKDTDDFFLGGRRVPPIVACLSFVATEISALTIVGIPHTAFTENWRWLPMYRSARHYIANAWPWPGSPLLFYSFPLSTNITAPASTSS